MTKFSIITICYNAEDSIGRTVDSVLVQRYRDFEYIVIDGGSTDRTLAELNKRSHEKLNVSSERDEGISDAFNKGIGKAEGEYLFFLNSGDYFINDLALDIVSKKLEENPSEIYTFSISTILNACIPKDEEEGLRLWESSMIPHQATFIRRDVFGKVGNFNPFFKVRMDYDFFSRCYLKKCSFACSPIVITHYDSSGISSTDGYTAVKEGMSASLLYRDKVDSQNVQYWKFLMEQKKIEGFDTNVVDELNRYRKLSDKYFKTIKLMNKWIQYYQDNKKISEYFNRNDFRTIAIYGMGDVGQRLFSELVKSDIKVSFGIDRNRNLVFPGLKIVDWTEDWEMVDIIVITPFYEYQTINKEIKKKCGYKTISVEELFV
ncbi:MAG: glycosyltransferase [Lachnospiraceae bacterium]|nr:glycosyltransferase [Lachnospiraceae bacterium]